MSVPAHVQKASHGYYLHYPEHPAREDDPHYKDFEEYRRRTEKDAQCSIGLARNDFSECSLDKPLELHHAHIEFSLQNGVDLAWLEPAYPGVSNPDEVGAWIESAVNLEWLCLTSDTPILMADGSQRPVCDVMPGDQVVTLDGSPQVVTGISRNKYRGDIVRLNSAGFTPSHRILTHRGWLGAAKIAGEIRMHGMNVIRVRREQYQVSGGIVRSVPVDMVDSFSRGEFPPDQILHDQDMFHNLTASPFTDSDISFRGDSTLALRPVKDFTRKGIKSEKPAFVGAVIDGAQVAAENADYRSAFRAYLNATAAPAELPAARTALRGTARVLTRQGFRDKEILFADDTSPDRQEGTLARGWWDTVRKAKIVSYSGYVHDLMIPHNKSMVAGGIVVHNCEFHHRGAGGAHVASASDYEAEKFVKGLISNS